MCCESVVGGVRGRVKKDGALWWFRVGLVVFLLEFQRHGGLLEGRCHGGWCEVDSEAPLAWQGAAACEV